MASRYSGQVHQRDNRTQLFSNVNSYNPQQVLYNSGQNSSESSSRTGTPFRQATPNSKGQYSDQTLSDLESQNDEQIEGLSAKVKLLKDITVRIGDEVRDSNKLLNNMEENFENARVRLRGTFTRMMRMAERSGVGWRAWVGLFAFIFLIFFYVWWR